MLLKKLFHNDVINNVVKQNNYSAKNLQLVEKKGLKNGILKKAKN